MKTSIDLNCDVGELDDINDMAFIPYVSSINVCCGEHAGDPRNILAAIRAAKKYNVKVGAHPSYPDRINFGRKSMDISLDELRATVHEQIMYIKQLCDQEEVPLHHVKPHGALYHDVLVYKDRLDVLLDVMSEFSSGIKLYGFANPPFNNVIRQRGIHYVSEGFIDRRYASSTALVSRAVGGSVLSSWDEIMQQIDCLLDDHVMTHTGDRLEMTCDTLCVHSDTPYAAAWMTKILNHLNNRGVRIH